MQIVEKPKETIFSMAYENRALRWATIALSVAITVALVVIWARPPAPVWLVREDGTIFRGDKKIFSWEAIEASRRGLELFFVKDEKREERLPDYFTGRTLSAAQSFQASDRFVGVRVDKVQEGAGGADVQATVLREGQQLLRFTLQLTRGERSERNPFGLFISSTSVQK